MLIIDRVTLGVLLGIVLGVLFGILSIINNPNSINSILFFFGAGSLLLVIA